MNNPSGVAVDTAGNIYIADSDNDRIRLVTKSTGNINTIAGNGVSGYSGDNGPATSAAIYRPTGVALDTAGNIYIADMGNSRIRLITKSTGYITTIAGNPSNGYNFGDNVPAVSAVLYSPSGIAVDAAGNIYISDVDGETRVRMISKSTGNITTIAGNGQYFYSGDNGPATAAAVNTPRGIAVDTAGNIYIADEGNNRIRMISKSTSYITTVAGTTYGYSGDNGPATSAKLTGPFGVAVDTAGNIYIADTGNNRIRMVTSYTPTSTQTLTPSCAPTALPTIAPTFTPSSAPTKFPTTAPTFTPSTAPTKLPTTAPTVTPSSTPTASPSIAPTFTPSTAPTKLPTIVPTLTPTCTPTKLPTIAPTVTPTCVPTASPTIVPTVTPSSARTKVPTTAPIFRR